MPASEGAAVESVSGLSRQVSLNNVVLDLVNAADEAKEALDTARDEAAQRLARGKEPKLVRKVALLVGKTR